MKRNLLLLLAVLLWLPAIAKDFTFTHEGQTLTYTVIDEEAKTCKTSEGIYYSDNKIYRVNTVSGDLVIPEVADGYKVVEIGKCAFPGCSGLTSVTIPNSVTLIGEYAFYKCSGLTSVTMGNSVTSISGSAFRLCSELTSVTIPNSVTYIGYYAFLGCTGLTSVTIGNSVTSIGESAFQSCSGLTSVIIPNSVTYIDSYAFSGCSGLASVTIGNSVTSIGKSAFQNCSGLTSVIIPNKVTSIGANAFNKCSGLKKSAYPSNLSNPFSNGVAFAYNPKGTIIEDGWIYDPNKESILFAPLSLEGEYVIPSSVTSIGEYSFYYCSGLTSITIPSSVTSIGASAFSDCSGLASVTIGNSVTSIGASAFKGCSKIPSIEIPNSVTSIGKETFSGCSALTSVVIADGDYGLIFGTYVFKDVPIKTLYLGRNFSWAGSVSSESELPFCNKTSLTSLTIGESVTFTQNYSFSGCSALTSVNIPKRVSKIGNNSFKDCSGLTSLIIGNAVETIGTSAFENCRGLTSVIIPNKVTSIGYGAFNNCTGLKKSAYPSTSSFSNPFSSGVAVEYNPEGAIIEDRWIYGPEKKEIRFVPYDLSGDYVIPSTVTSIGESAFDGCSGLTSVTMGNSVTSIGASAFYRCSGLTSVNIGNAVETIGESAFDGCSGLTSVVIADGDSELKFGLGVFKATPIETLYLGRNFSCSASAADQTPFYDKTSMKTLTISDKVTSIGNYAFYRCSGLTSVTIPNSVTSIGASAFYYCSGLTSVTIGNSVTSIGNYAFYRCEGLTSVTIPNSVETIGANAFQGCSELASVNIPQKVNSIKDYTFSGCSKLTSVTIPNSVTSIRMSAFQGCSGLTSIEIPNSVTSIGAYAFNACGLISVIIPNSVTTIGDNAFYYCGGLKKSAYPSNLKNPFSNGVAVAYNPKGAIIEDGWIYGPNKESILFAPLSLEGEYIIPSSVTSIGARAFASCSGLTSVKTLGINSPTLPENAFDDTVYEKVPLDIPENSLANYLATNWFKFKNITVDGITIKEFNDGTFKYRLIQNPDNREAILEKGDYSSLTEASIPERFTDDTDASNPVRYYVTGIGREAFVGCANLKTVTFHSRSIINTIGASAFSGCTRLTSIIIPDSVASIGASAFYGCSALTSVNIPQKVNSIEDNTFYSCGKLTAITIPDSIASIGASAFYGCSALTSIEIPNSVTSIGNNAFNGCSKVNSVVIADADSELKFGTDVFKSVPIQTLYLGRNYSWEGSVSVSALPFCNKTSLTSLTIGDKVTRISNSALQGCTGIKSVEIPNSVTSIGNNAFYGCTGLTSVTIPNSVTSIGASAFNGCSKITSIEIPNSVTSIATSAFSECKLTSFKVNEGTEAIALGADIFKYASIGNLYIGRTISTDNNLQGSVTNLEFGNLVKAVPDSVFKGCGSLTSLSLGSAITSIGNEAFSGCNLKEVVLPPMVDSIGASAFAGNKALATISMGANVKKIGEKAFDGCSATEVRITAQTPPSAPNNTFSSYSGKLLLQDTDKKIIDAYYDAFTCWDRFSGVAMIVPTKVESDNKKVMGKPGDTVQLSVKFTPTDVTLPYIFWHSTNPEVATVDNKGLVTILAEITPDSNCKIISETLYFNGPVVEFEVVDESGAVENIVADKSANGDIDYNEPYEVYNFNGMKIGDSKEDLAPGLYIIRQGRISKKIAIQ